VVLAVQLSVAVLTADATAPRPAAAAALAPAAGCRAGLSRETCDRRDPDQEGCSARTEVLDKVVLTTAAGRRVGVLRLVFSPLCATTWGRLSSDDGDPSRVSIAFLRPVPGGNGLEEFGLFPGPLQAATGVRTVRNSPMVFGARVSQAVGALTVGRTGEFVSRSTRNCPPPGSPGACPPPPVEPE
jgi:hypothetical protein